MNPEQIAQLHALTSQRQKEAMAIQNSKPQFGLTEQDAANLLSGLCVAEVSSRGGQLNADQQFLSRVQLVARWITRSSRSSLLLVGSCGNGKTTIARALCMLINNANRLCGAVNVRVWLYTADEIVKAAYGKLEGKEGVFQKLKATPILFIDDLGIEAVEVKEYGNSSLPIVELLAYRYDRQLCTIVTTNESVEVLGQRYGSRIADRINEAFAVIPFDGASFRK